MKKSILALTVITILSTACALTDNYEFGDVSRMYCAATTPEAREVFKVALQSSGVELPADYCSTVGFIDAMIKL